MYVYRKIRALSRNHCCHGQAVIITYSVCVFVFSGVQHAKSMRRIVLSPVACPAVPVFPHYLTNGTIFWKMLCNINMCVPILCTVFVWNVILSRTERNIITNVRRSSCKVRVIAVRVLIKLEFSRQILGKTSNIRLHKYPSSGSRVVPCGRTDRHGKASGRFSRFCERV